MTSRVCTPAIPSTKHVLALTHSSENGMPGTHVKSSHGEHLDELLQFYKYPTAIRYALYTTNAIERTIKEIRKRIRPMNSLANVNAAEKITYLFVTGYNDKWSKRGLRGFADPETKEFLTKVFNERYGSISE